MSITRARFKFMAEASVGGGKTTVVRLKQIQLECQEKVFIFPPEFQSLACHKELMKMPAARIAKKSLKKRNTYRNPYVSMNEALRKIYIKDNGNPSFRGDLPEESSRPIKGETREVLPLSINGGPRKIYISDDEDPSSLDDRLRALPITDETHKSAILPHTLSIRSSTDEMKPYNKIASITKNALIEEYGGKNFSAVSGIGMFERECHRPEIRQNENCVEGSAIDWYHASQSTLCPTTRKTWRKPILKASSFGAWSKVKIMDSENLDGTADAPSPDTSVSAENNLEELSQSGLSSISGDELEYNDSNSEEQPCTSKSLINDTTSFDVLDYVEEPFENAEESSSEEDAPAEAVRANYMRTFEFEDDEFRDTVDAEDRQQYEEQEVVEIPENLNEVSPLPEGWKAVYHESGALLYWQPKTNVCCLARPYFLGAGSTKSHALPETGIPCLYQRNLPSEENPPPLNAVSSPVSQSENTVGSPNPQQEEAITPSDTQMEITVTSPNAHPENTSPHPQPENTPPHPPPENSSPQPQLENAVTSSSKISDYCKRLFKLKTIKYLKFRSWDVRRNYLRTLRNERNRRKLHLTNKKFISFPIVKRDDEGKVLSNKKWIITPRGRSYVAILHEYLQQSLKTHPVYSFKEVDNAKTPYAATVIVNGDEYGTGVGMSKKDAKLEAAKATLLVLLPKMKKDILNTNEREGKKENDSVEEEMNIASIFDDIEITDPRVTELSKRTTEPTPYELLLKCLQKKDDKSEVKFDLNMESAECTMSVGEHTVTVQCDNKREGKQLAAQSLLKLLHPYIENWGSLLRLYGNDTNDHYQFGSTSVAEEKDLEEVVPHSAPNKKLLARLRSRMLRLREDPA